MFFGHCSNNYALDCPGTLRYFLSLTRLLDGKRVTFETFDQSDEEAGPPLEQPYSPPQRTPTGPTFTKRGGRFSPVQQIPPVE